MTRNIWKMEHIGTWVSFNRTVEGQSEIESSRVREPAAREKGKEEENTQKSTEQNNWYLVQVVLLVLCVLW